MFKTPRVVLLLAVPVVTVVTAGCDDAEKATPQAMFEGETQRGSGNVCRVVSPLSRVGDFATPAAAPPLASKPIADGQTNGGTDVTDPNTVNVSCSVVASGPDTFDVAGSILLAGGSGGFFRIDGKFKTTGEQTGVHAIFSSNRTTNTY